MSSPIASTVLNILVFGPNPTVTHSDPFLRALTKKRIEIRDALRGDGHQVDFPEDLAAGPSDLEMGNAYLHEVYLVRKYDMVVNLVGSPGSISELALLMQGAGGSPLALKAAMFFNQDHMTGLPFQQAQVIRAMGGTLDTYVYPVDLDACHLMKAVRVKVHDVQIAKFYVS